MRGPHALVPAAVLSLAALGSHAAPDLSPACLEDAREGIARGVRYLVAAQKDDGAWGQDAATTGLVCLALANSPEPDEPQTHTAIQRGADFLGTAAQTDGSIRAGHKAPDSVYNTAAGLMALAFVNRPQDQTHIRRAREYLLEAQSTDAAKDGASFGGFSHSRDQAPDLWNTQWALEALYLTDHLDRAPFCTDPERAERVEKAWERVPEFLTRCQNLKATNDQPWVASDPDNAGGFVDSPGASRAWEIKQGEHSTLTSTGGMTYAGLKCMVYAQFGKDDARVRAALAWVGKHFTLTENPGLGPTGLFFCHHTCAKALAGCGQDVLTDADGKARKWREELVVELVDQQDRRGFWVNRKDGGMETSAALVTAYSLLAIEIVTGDTMWGAWE